jgi:hypothetical protein
MKKIITVALALMMVLSFSALVFAGTSEDTFVPSVPVKPAPVITSIELIKDGETIEKVPMDCLLITPVADAMAGKSDPRLPAAAESLLISVYNQLGTKTMELPRDVLSKYLNPDNAIIRDLVDITWVCEEKPSHMDKLADPAVQLKVTMTVKGLIKGEPLCVMTYDESKNIWEDIAGVEYVGADDKGNAIIACTFDHLCPAAFVVQTAPSAGEVETNNMEIMLWTCVLVASAAALVIVVAKRRQNIA